MHIGGVHHTLKTSGGKIASTGIFVGGGSFGVIIGQLLGMLHKDYLVLIPILFTVLFIVILISISRRYVVKKKKWSIDITSKISTGWVVFIAFMVTAIRAYIGYAIPTE